MTRPCQVSLNSISQRAKWRRIMQVGVASLAVIAMGPGATLSAYAASNRSAAIGGTKAPAGPPKYYVTQNYSQKQGSRLTVVVRKRTTGRITSIVRDPLPRFSCGDDLAAAGTHTFFLTCQIWGKKPGSHQSVVKEARIYRFEVNNSGRASTPTLLKGGTLQGFFGEHLTASADGSRVAIMVFRPNPDGNLYTNSVAAGIFVIDTKTGKRALWRTGPYVPGKIGYTDASDISLTGDGSELVVLGTLCHRTRYLSNCESKDPREVRAFGPADHGGSLQGGKVLLRLSAFKKPRTGIPDALITPDGTALTSVIINCPKRGICTLSVEQIRLTSGLSPKVLYRVHTGTRIEGIDLRYFASDPTGRFLILNAAVNPTSKWVNGWIDHGRLVRLTPADFAGQEVW